MKKNPLFEKCLSDVAPKVKAEVRLNIEKEIRISLSKDDLELLSDICHSYKDYHRNCSDCIKNVMRLEAKLSEQTGGAYEADTTYDIRNS